MSNIGENIKSLRETAGISQEKLGECIGKTRSAVSQYESGKIIPRMGVIEDIAHVFRVSKLDILGGSENYVLIRRDGSDELSDDEKELLRLYSMADETGKRMMLENAATISHYHSM